MHEMSLTMSMIELAEEHCRKADPSVKKITGIWLEIGALSCAEPETIEYCFDVARRTTMAEDAKLHIVRAKGVAWCVDCEKEIQLEVRGMACPHCNGFNLRLTAGDELRIKDIEVE
ncbi:hydrogenase maturation nickel metallochaperone HypA [Sansalvadorimonas verongulae]|uniref:hydrogenase maturation nickel metallochaperone HypA n=1 Tax=Sansalvadorimonas verongulae TaxID=2172824 RepID=UPI0012BB52D0|nr:hydrogenase maturation nickel metallochaperone HypA [Sansalvadorimonas verongulae]MTI15374.1 hydrogenase maturation nickel metallochaperone HypA [Sansalvadorimonas verongulae]